MIKYKLLIFAIFLIIITITLLVLKENYHFDVFISKDTCNHLCQKDKYNRVKEKGYFSDKIKIKEYLSENYPHINYAKLLYQTSDAKSLKNISLPENFVLKNSSGSRMFQIVKDGNYDINKLIEKSKYFLSIDYGNNSYRKIPFFNLKEPQYSYNQRKILIEEYIPDTEEFRVILAKGEILFYEWLGDKKEYRLDKEWKNIKVYPEDKNKKNKEIEKPKYLEQINDFCKDFYQQHKFNYTRMDFLINQEDFYFGEVTFTPDNCRKTTLDSFNKKFKHLFQ